MRKAEKAVAACKEAGDTEVAAIQAQADRLRSEVGDLKNATSFSIAASHDRIHALQARFINVMRLVANLKPRFGSSMLVCHCL